MTDKPLPEWTVIVYMAGNNSLAEECVFNLTEMKRVGSTDEVAVVAQLETSVSPASRFHFTQAGAEKVEIPESGPANTSKPELGEPGERGGLRENGVRIEDAGDADGDHPFPKLLSDFITWAIQNYPAKHYMLVLSGHSSGAVGPFLPGKEHSRPLTIPGLFRLLNRIREHFNLPNHSPFLDILGLDSCLMSMAEMCHAAHKYARVLIGAQGFEPMAGWPYERVLGKLNEFAHNSVQGQPGALNDLASDIVKVYRVLALSRVTRDLRGEAQAVNAMGDADYALGHMQRAISEYQRALALWEGLNDRRGQALALLNSGYTFSDLGNTQKAFECYTESLAKLACGRRSKMAWRDADRPGQTLFAAGRKPASANLIQRSRSDSASSRRPD